MSRVGKKPITIPSQVKVTLAPGLVSAEGPKGKLSHRLCAGVQVQQEGAVLKVEAQAEDRFTRAQHGLTRTLIHNMVEGVHQGFSKELEIQGVGFKAQASAGKLELSLGFTHPVIFPIPASITIETPKPTVVVIKGPDKALVGQVAARIRDFFPPEPYKGKGIRYAGEVVRRKAGKAVA
ncbi:MAG: 50S ribosomal protein L6 [Candidatus Omnitrophica bacterium]|nr:50S ribosomal protein L6 [Candidatus Omnitrophota bacterium]